MLVFVIDNNRYKFFKEYLQSVAAQVPTKFKLYNPRTKLKFNPNAIYVQRMPPQLSGHKGIVLNTEQLTNLQKRQQFMRQMKNVHVDYSSVNLRFSNVSNKFFIPYQLNPKEIRHTDVPKLFDVVIVQPKSERRICIYQQLVKRGFRCAIAQGWGDDRDDVIRRGKILLNIHFSPDYNVYESIRCDRWVMNKTMVVSETSLLPNDPVVNHVIFVPYNKIVEKVTEILQDYDNHYEKLFQEFNLETIRRKKRKKLDRFITNLISQTPKI